MSALAPGTRICAAARDAPAAPALLSHAGSSEAEAVVITVLLRNARRVNDFIWRGMSRWRMDFGARLLNFILSSGRNPGNGPEYPLRRCCRNAGKSGT